MNTYLEHININIKASCYKSKVRNILIFYNIERSLLKIFSSSVELIKQLGVNTQNMIFQVQN